MLRHPLRQDSAAALLTIGTAVAVMTAGCAGSSSQSTPTRNATVPSCITPEGGKGCLPLAKDAQRVDLGRPVFSHPASVTNPLNPLGKLDQVIYGGQVDGKPWRTEFTRLGGTKPVTWDGRTVETVVMQYLAFSDGRIDEVALDRFGQADDGSVWYFGEDVFNYADGVVKDHEGTWLAGRHGPAAMITPTRPKVGDAYRSENIPGLVFEEVTVKNVGQRVTGPSGRVEGAYTASELHMDGQREDKIFAPGYGEFSTGSPNGDLEEVTLAIPTDAHPGPLPAKLAAFSAAVGKTFDAVGTGDWTRAAAASQTLKRAWAAYRSDGLPDLLEKQTNRDVGLLTGTIAARDGGRAQQAALRIAQDNLDLQVRHRPVQAIDSARLILWARQIGIDAAAAGAGSVAGDVASLKWTWDRVRPTVDQTRAAGIDTQLSDLQQAADAKDTKTTAKATPALLTALTAIQPR
ncbi:hypothetical protein ACFLIM_29635 [Nonomuraea sp. M3C6]|uniref:Uncharacterized protein n=1 Tax=Nonomuraea marmarensis TaxID=3351344 RepID=A0ABW7AJR8_9ACTN